MGNDLVLIATTAEVLKYAGKTCVEASKEFDKEFRLDNAQRPFVNYFLHMIQDGNRKTSYHWNYGIMTPDKFDPVPDLDGMVEKYLNVGVPGTTIRMVMPPLVITHVEAIKEVIGAFARAGYHKQMEVPRV
jgi:hypothetical protein